VALYPAGHDHVRRRHDDDVTVAGRGVWAADGSARGFIEIVPEPVTALLPALGGIAADEFGERTGLVLRVPGGLIVRLLPCCSPFLKEYG